MLKLYFFTFLSTALAVETIVVDSFETGNPASYAIDGNPATFWHTEYNPVEVPLPHHAIIDLGTTQNLNGFTYLPRQDGNLNGNIGQHTIELSLNNLTWTLVASATFVDDDSLKETGFPDTLTQYIRITALTEAGNRGPWTSAAEFGVNIVPSYNGLGEWGPVILFPLVPAGAFVQHDTGKILTFSAYGPDYFAAGVSYVHSPSFFW
jgi:galactose oxidase